MDLFVVDVTEVDAPPDVEKLHWRLLTTHAVTSVDQAKEIVLRPRGPVRCRAPGSGGLPGGSFALAFVEDRREFFGSTSKAAVSASALSLRCSLCVRQVAG